jgi:DNA-binding CsgD family transcriptional regulator
MRAKQHIPTEKRVRFDTTQPSIAQTGASNPALVRLTVKENHKLSAREIDHLVQTYNAGNISQRELAHQFSIHVETANRHLRRRRQALKLGAMTVCHAA